MSTLVSALFSPAVIGFAVAVASSLAWCWWLDHHHDA